MTTPVVRWAALAAAPLLLAACSSATTTGASQSPTTAASSASAATSTSPSEKASAGTQVAPLPTGGVALASTKWSLSGVNWTTEDVTTFTITLDFDADQASGFAGVNRYTGGYTSSTEGTLKFSALASTQMAGDEAAMAMETKYLAALSTVTNYSTNGDLLDLFAGPDQILTFTQAS